MRIAIYHNLHSGGAKRVVMEQAYRLSARHDVTLFTLSTADQSFGLTGMHLPFAISVAPFTPLKSLPSPWGRLNPLLALATLRQLDRQAWRTAQQIDAQGFDVVLVHPCQMTQTPLLMRWMRTPSLYYCHELPRRLYEAAVPRLYRVRNRLRRTLDAIDPLPWVQSSILRGLDRHCARRATQIVVNSAFTAENVRTAYRREAAVCMPAVEARRFQPRGRERDNFVLSVGSLTANKGFDFVIAALATIPAAARPRLVIISNYEEVDERHYLSAQAATMGVAVEMRVGVPETELEACYARAGCVAYAPINEPLGLVTLEAMASGSPLVAVNEGGVAEPILDGMTGLCLPRNVYAFGETIRQLLADRQRAQALGERARQHVLSHCNWDRHLSTLESLLRNLPTVKPAVVPIRNRRLAS
jgi:glycosyltransferase involved in cell wall biosynthesis